MLTTNTVHSTGEHTSNCRIWKQRYSKHACNAFICSFNIAKCLSIPNILGKFNPRSSYFQIPEVGQSGVIVKY